MDFLQEIVDSFSSIEQKTVRKHIAENSFPAIKKLLDFHVDSPEVVTIKDASVHLFGVADKNALNRTHQLRFQLISDLEHFIQSSFIQQNSLVSIENTLLTAEYFFERKQHNLGWKYLTKAEKQAQESDRYNLLDRIYYKQLEQAHLRPQASNSDLLQKWESNKKLAKLDEALNTTLSNIRSRIRVDHEAGKVVDIEAITNEIFQQQQLHEGEIQSAPFQAKLAQVLFELAELKKDYNACAEILIKNYTRLEKDKKFDKKFELEKAVYLEQISESLVKSFRFQECEHYLELLHQQLKLTKSPYVKFLKSRFILFICLVCTRKLEESGTLLRKLELEYKNPKNKEVDQYYYRCLHSNWMSYHLFKGDYKNGLQHILYNLKLEKKHMALSGVLFVILLNLNEIMIRIDLNEHLKHLSMENLNYKLRSIERRFKSILEDPRHRSLKDLIALLRQIIINPDHLKGAKGLQEFKDMSANWQSDHFKSEILPVRNWFQHKLDRITLYDQFLKSVQN